MQKVKSANQYKNKEYQKILLAILIIVIFFLALPAIVNAQLSLSIFPEKFDLELSRGEISKNEIRVSNLGDTPLTINIDLKNFSAADERGKIIFQESDDISFNPSQWIKFSPKKIVLEPRESKLLNFNIEVPATAEPGGHYAIALFQTEISSTVENDSVEIIPNLGTLFLLKVKGAEEKYPALDRQIELVELNVPSFIEFGPLNISFRLKNNDPVHIRVGGKIVIYDIFGKKKEEIKIDEQTILAEKIRFFEVSSSDEKIFDKFFIGPYNGELILSTITWREKIGTERQLVREINFLGLPWKIILIIIFLIFLIFLIKRLSSKSTSQKSKSPKNQSLPEIKVSQKSKSPKFPHISS